MLNNFIGGGQVFLHKVRMFRQVLRTTVFVSVITGIILAWSFNHQSKLMLIQTISFGKGICLPIA